MEPLSLKLFGDVKLMRGPNGEIALPRKTRMLLAYLASDGGNPIPRDKLAGLIWHDRAEEQARHSLRQCLFTFAKSIGDDAAPLVDADRNHVSLNTSIVEVDTWRFERLLAENTPDAMRQAVALHTGDFAAGVSFDDETLDTWCAAERTRFRELCYETLARLSSHYADTARLDEAIEAGRRLVTLDPLREDGHRILMRLFGRAGRRAEALKQYRHCRDILRTELNVEPEAATVNLYTDIKGQRNKVETASEIADHSPDHSPSAREPEKAAHLASVDRKRVALVAGLLLIIVLAAVMFWLNVGQSS
jgi:DNA-binding SARP family transcriptional activator